MITLLSWALPALNFAKSWIPGWSQVRAFLWAIAISILFGAGAVAGSWGARRGEPARIEKAARPLCDAWNAKARELQLKKALVQQTAQNDFRGQRITELNVIIEGLENEKRSREDHRPSADTECVPGDSPWLQQSQRPVRSRR